MTDLEQACIDAVGQYRTPDLHHMPAAIRAYLVGIARQRVERDDLSESAWRRLVDRVHQIAMANDAPGQYEELGRRFAIAVDVEARIIAQDACDDAYAELTEQPDEHKQDDDLQRAADMRNSARAGG